MVKVTRELLRNLYTRQKKSPSEIGNILCMSSRAVYKNLIKYGISLRESSTSKVISEEQVKKIIELYNAHQSSTLIGTAVGLSQMTVLKILRRHNRPIRPRGRIVIENPKLTRELLQNLYIRQKKTCKEIGDIVGVNSMTVNSYLHRYGIATRTQGMYSLITKKDVNKMIELYTKKQKSLREISAMMGISRPQVHYHLVKHGVSLRSAGRRNAVINDAEKANKIINLYEKYKSSQKVSKMVGISHVHVINVLRKYNKQPVGHSIMDKRKQTYLKKYAHRMTYSRLSKYLGVDHTVIHYWIQKLDLPTPPREYSIPRKFWNSILEEYNNGAEKIYNKYNTCPGVIHATIRRAGGTIKQNRWW